MPVEMYMLARSAHQPRQHRGVTMSCDTSVSHQGKVIIDDISDGLNACDGCGAKFVLAQPVGLMALLKAQ